jgi:hypothetical protein
LVFILKIAIDHEGVAALARRLLHDVGEDHVVRRNLLSMFRLRVDLTLSLTDRFTANVKRSAFPAFSEFSLLRRSSFAFAMREPLSFLWKDRATSRRQNSLVRRMFPDERSWRTNIRGAQPYCSLASFRPQTRVFRRVYKGLSLVERVV